MMVVVEHDAALIHMGGFQVHVYNLLEYAEHRHGHDPGLAMAECRSQHQDLVGGIVSLSLSLKKK